MRVRRALAAVAAAAVTVVAGASTPAGAASSVESGWWTSAPVPVAPDAGDDHLVVQGGLDAAQPTAFAGISFALAPGEVPETLVLKVAPNSTPGAKLAACALGGQARAAKGEPADSAPPFDCSTKVESAPAADGASYEFAVAGFAGDGVLDVAILPTGPADRVVLEKPAVDALEGAAGGGASSSDGGFSDGGFSDGGFSDGGFSDGGFAGGGDALQPGEVFLGGTRSFGPDLAAGVEFPPPALDATPPAAATGGSSVGVASPAAALGGDGSRSVAPFLFGGLAAAAAALWALAGHASPEEGA